MRREVIATVSYFVSSEKDFTDKEAFDYIKKKMRCGVRCEEFNKQIVNQSKLKTWEKQEEEN